MDKRDELTKERRRPTDAVVIGRMPRGVLPKYCPTNHGGLSPTISVTFLAILIEIAFQFDII